MVKDSLSNYFELLDSKTQENLKLATRTYRQRFRELVSLQELKAIKEKASCMRENNLRNVSKLWENAKIKFERNGVYIHFAQDNNEALAIIRVLLKGKKHIVKSKSNLLYEIDIPNSLDQQIIETDIGDWLVQEMELVRINPNAPAIGISAEDISGFLKERYELSTYGSPEFIISEVCNIIRRRILNAEVGLTGVNFVTSEGQLVVCENEGNISLVTRLPQTHIAVVAYHRIVENLEEATYLSKCLAIFGTGRPSTAYINAISSPSYTTDIEKKLVYGTQGAREVHLVVVDNGRSSILQNDKLRQAFKCIGCGACMLFCPVSELAGPNFGGIYQGGIGLIFSHFALNQNIGFENGVFACLGCEMCEEVCPVDAKIWDNIKEIRKSLVSDIAQLAIAEVQSKGFYSYMEQ